MYNTRNKAHDALLNCDIEIDKLLKELMKEISKKFFLTIIMLCLYLGGSISTFVFSAEKFSGNNEKSFTTAYLLATNRRKQLYFNQFWSFSTREINY